MKKLKTIGTLILFLFLFSVSIPLAAVAATEVPEMTRARQAAVFTLYFETTTLAGLIGITPAERNSPGFPPITLLGKSVATWPPP